MDVGIAGDAFHVAERLAQRCPKRDADILHRVVLVDMEVALGVDRQVDQAVAGDLVQHVVEEADAGLDPALAGAVEVDGDRDVGFLGFARDGGAAHGIVSLASALYQGLDAIAIFRAGAGDRIAQKCYSGS